MPAIGARITVMQCSFGPSMKSWSWLCWSRGPRHGIGRRALSVLAQAFGPELDVPLAELSEPVGIRHHHHDANAAVLVEADGGGRADGRREVARMLGGEQVIDTALAPARKARTSSPRASAGSRPTLVRPEKRPPMPV